jgi:hypothetical protein
MIIVRAIESSRSRPAAAVIVSTAQMAAIESRGNQAFSAGSR